MIKVNEETIAEIVKRYQAGENPTELARIFHVGRSSVYRWIKSRTKHDVQSVTEQTQREIHKMPPRRKKDKKKKYNKTTHERVLAARRQGKTLKEIVAETGVSRSTVKLWLAKAAEQNVEGIKIQKQHTEDERKMILADYAKTKSVKKTCTKYHISRDTLHNWMAQNKVVATSQKGTVYTARQVNKMKRDLESLQMENKIIRQCHCTASDPIQERVEEVSRLQNLFSIHSLCNVLDLSRATYYRLSLEQKDKTQYEKNDDMLRPIIETEFYDSGERFGAPMIKVKINDRGIAVSIAHIQRLMREMDLVPKQNRSRVFNSTHRQYRYRRNRLRRHFTQDVPNKFWVSDITYARVNDEFYAVCVVLDLFSRKVLSYGISPEMNSDLVRTTFLKAFESRNRPEGLTFHSDQGCQYTAYSFRKLLRELGVRQSLSNPGTPHDNAVMESFFATLKREELSHNWYNTPEELDKTIREYIDFYNLKRPHRKLKMQTPDQFEQNYWKSQATL